MQIEYYEDAQPGDEIAATIYGCNPTDDTGFGTGLKWLLIDRDGRTRTFYTPDTVTKRNRLGRTVVRLLGELRQFDSDELIGMTVTVQYISKKTDATQAVADLLVPRKPGKGEDVTATVAKAQEAEKDRDQSAPF